MPIFWHILELYVIFCHFFFTIRVFWTFYAVLLQIRFVVIYALFRKNIFCLNHICVKIFFITIINFLLKGTTVQADNKHQNIKNVILLIYFHVWFFFFSSSYLLQFRKLLQSVKLAGSWRCSPSWDCLAIGHCD